jgi:RimJ/RimL family protein N-acetyltransferase
MNIRPADTNDAPSIWRIIGPTIRAGETYALDREMTEADALAYWLGDDRETFVAEEDGEIIGTYYIRANQAGGGKHICNCGYMTSAAATGRGIARAMCRHSLNHAQQRGYRGLTSSSAPIHVPWRCGNPSGLRSSAVCHKPSITQNSDMSMRW